jgi:hypothetical protein
MADSLTLTEAVQAAGLAVTNTIIERIHEHEQAHGDDYLSISLNVVYDNKPCEPQVIFWGLALQGIFGIATEMMREQNAAADSEPGV